jgi:hypothetical protein
MTSPSDQISSFSSSLEASMIFGRFKFISLAAAGGLHWPRLPVDLRDDLGFIFGAPLRLAIL